MRFEIILLGVIQGLTEWLPISSTGHLKLAEIILGLRLPLLFDIILHMGTLAITILFFRSDVKEVLRALVKLDLYKSEGGIMLQRILISTAFTATIGPLIMSLESLFHEVKMIGRLFLVSGLIIYLSKIKVDRDKHVNPGEAALIGAMQGFSVLPGLSRSGLTISAALMLGVRREEAFKFSFLLSIPAILGGLIITLITQHDALQKVELGAGEILLGAFISAFLGYFSLKILRRTLKHFHNFAFYPLLLGSLLVLLGGS
ncbi:MAG: undecaprenyl-diphosphate phosphatase [Candidatus Bathyarchaeia archaeon]